MSECRGTSVESCYGGGDDDDDDDDDGDQHSNPVQDFIAVH